MVGMVEMVDSFQYLGIIATADGGTKEDQESKCSLYAVLPCIPEQKCLKQEKNWDIRFNSKTSYSNESETWRTDQRSTS